MNAPRGWAKQRPRRVSHSLFGLINALSSGASTPESRPPSAMAATSVHHAPMLAESDPNALAHMFKGQLASLTFNSKPLITNLTVIALENANFMAHVLAQCLEEHIMTAVPAVRLPALYALDSICKNVGAPYTLIWSSRIVYIFMETYRVVDQAVKVRMEELLNTWRDAGPSRTPLFGAAPQQAIEQALWGKAGPPTHIRQRQHQQLQPQQVQHQAAASPYHHHYQQQHQQQFQGTSTPPHFPGSAAAPVDAGSMLSRFDRLIAACTHDKHYNPHLFDAARLEALTKLRGIVASTSLSPAEMSQIAVQLDSLEGEIQNRSSGSVHVRSPPHSYLTSHEYQRATPPVQNIATAAGAASNALRSPPHHSVSSSASALPPSLAGSLANLSKLSGNRTPPLHRSTPPPPHSQPHVIQQRPQQSHTAFDLVASLRQAGLLPASNAAAVEAPDQDAEYCQMIKGLNIRLTTIDLQRALPLGSLDAIAAKELPLQCRQCANRYPSGPTGQASLDKHLDWHFRQNRRAKDSTVRGQSRSWFSRLDEWVRGGHDDTAPFKRSGANGENDGGETGGGVGAALTPTQEAELKAATEAFVVAPNDDPDASTRPCPVCKELFKSEWSEDEEEWIWKNCVKVDGVFYHGSCHYSAKMLSNAVGRMVPGASTNGGSSATSTKTSSRDGTPQPTSSLAIKTVSADPVVRIKEEQGLRATSTAGVKRKSSPTEDVTSEAGQHDKIDNQPQSTTPPAKRVAVEGE